MSNLFISKWRVNSGIDRATFGQLALAMCKQAQTEDGVDDARFYWCDANTVGLIISAAVGKWGPGSKISGATNKTIFALADISHVIMDESWMSARDGESNYQSSL